MVAVQPSGGKVRQDVEYLIRESADVEDVLTLGRLRRGAGLESMARVEARGLRAPRRSTRAASPSANAPRQLTTCLPRRSPQSPFALRALSGASGALAGTASTDASRRRWSSRCPRRRRSGAIVPRTVTPPLVVPKDGGVISAAASTYDAAAFALT